MVSVQWSFGMTRTSATNALDGMRGIASVIVLMNHLVLAFLSSDFLARTINAKLAVVFFFVHSGFVLSVAPLSTDEEVATRVARRYVRLAPLVVVSCLVAWLLLLFGQIRFSGSSSVWLASFYQFDCDVFYALYAGFFHSFFVVKGETVASLNPVLWTIGTELAGSILVLTAAITRVGHRPRG
jgi:peptidoglycan/LPS O-acetylase OafA/YrhL